MEDASPGKLFAQFAFAEVTAKNKILDYIGKNPSIGATHPELIEVFDSFAKDVASFDIHCVIKLKADFENDKADYFKARQLDSVGGYWVAKGENFGVSSNDSVRLRRIEIHQTDTIKALCDAKSAYATALRLAKEPLPAPQSDEYDKLDSKRSAGEPETLLIEIQAGWDRADHALSNYPTAEVDQACK